MPLIIPDLGHTLPARPTGRGPVGAPSVPSAPPPIDRPTGRVPLPPVPTPISSPRPGPVTTPPGPILVNQFAGIVRPDGVVVPLRGPPPPPPPNLVPSSAIPPGFQSSAHDDPLTIRERAESLKNFGIAGGVALMPAPSRPVDPAINPALYTALGVAYFALGAGIHDGRLKASPVALGAWFALPKPFGFQDPRVYGLSEHSFAPKVFHTLRDYIVEDLYLGRLAAQREGEREYAIRNASYADSRRRLGEFTTESLVAIAGADRLPMSTRWILTVPSARYALRDELLSRGFRIQGNRLIPPPEPPIDERGLVGVGNVHGDP